MTRILLDTNLYVEWSNHGRHEGLTVGPGFVRYLSAVVQMELRAGAATRPARRTLDRLIRAHTAAARLVAPAAPTTPGSCCRLCAWPGERFAGRRSSTTYSSR